MRGWFFAGLGISLFIGGQAVVGCVGDDAPIGSSNDRAEAGEVGAATGAACAAGAECSSGNCVDGVCCESACSGTCESCNLPGKVGRCEPIPDGEDPAAECPTIPLPDAGAPTAPDADDSGAGDAEAPTSFVIPDGGITLNHNPCAGKCNGQRACAYPGGERTCGSVFCGTPISQGRASCDSKGHCLFGIEECKAYSCTDGSPGCKEACTSESDCLATHFCDTASNTCKAKLANGASCEGVGGNACASGHCADGVCCNDACTGYAGAKCDVPGSKGQCTCSACPGKTCKLYFRDEDGDGYGDKFGTVANGRAVPGCESGPAPAGFVDNDTDCFDGPPPPNSVAQDVHPGQTDYFKDPYVAPITGALSWDYNCNNKFDKQTPEVPGGSCTLCRTNDPYTDLYGNVIVTCAPATGCPIQGSEPRMLSCTRGGGAVPDALTCGGLRGPAFDTTVGCGASGTRIVCGGCSSGLITGSSTTIADQLCR